MQRLRVLEFEVTSSLNGKSLQYGLLERLSKDSYLEQYGLSFIVSRNEDDLIYVDLDTKELWKLRSSDFIPASEFDEWAIKTELNGKFTIDSKPSTNLANLQLLKESLVSWWCK